MKILIVTPKYYPDTFPINLIAERLVKEGNEVDVLTSIPFRNGKYLKEYVAHSRVENGVNVFRVKTKIRKRSKYSLVSYYLSLHNAFTKWVKKCDKKYDLVYSYSISPVISLAAGNLYKKKYNVPHFVHVLDLWPESVVDAGYTNQGTWLYKFLFKWSKKEYAQADRLLIGSKSFKDYLTSRMDIDPKKIEYLVQLGLVYDDNDSPNPFDPTKTNLLYCGNISKLQLVNFIIPAMEETNDPNVIFNVIGDGSYLDEFLKTVKERELNNIVYHGYYNYKDSARYLKNADAILVSLKNIGFVGNTIPNKLISALYYKKPILGMIHNEGREILEVNNNLILNQSSADLAFGIEKFQAISKKDRELIGNKNRQQYDDNYSIDKFIKKLLSSFSRK